MSWQGCAAAGRALLRSCASGGTPGVSTCGLLAPSAGKVARIEGAYLFKLNAG